MGPMRHRRLAAAALATLLSVGPAGCRNDDPVVDTSGASRPVEVRSVNIEVRGGVVVGDQQVIVAQVGERVRLSVRSDVADEVALVDTDVKLQVPAGGVATLELPTDVPRVHDIVLTQQSVTLARLEVGQ